MSKDFNNESQSEDWALILGGSSGLGLASAKKLASHGMYLCIVHRTRRSELSLFESEKTKLQEQGIKVVDFNIDALKTESQQKVADFFIDNRIKINLLLHSIAKGNLKPVYSQSGEAVLSTTDFELSISAMATSLYSWVSLFLKKNLFSKNGRILSFTSSGSKKALPHYAAVGAAKAALESITRSLAYELAPLGITANCIEAGVTDTESLKRIPGSEVLKKEAALRNPYQRLTTPEEVANAVYLLSRKESSWINGTVIQADGGEHLL